MNRKLHLLGIVIALVLAFAPIFTFTPAAEAGNPPEPTYATATVDGDYSEWDLSDAPVGDFFADMYRAANPNNDVLAKLYMRYDCSTGTAYVLVLAQNGYPLYFESEGDFVKIGAGGNDVDNTSGNDGVAPDFEFVVEGGQVIGWEASFPLADGIFTTLDVHTNVDDGASQTAAVANRGIDLTIDCAGHCNPAPTRTISGFVYYDENENGIYEPFPAGFDDVISGATVNITAATNANSDSLVPVNFAVVTDASGYFNSGSLEPGTYTISQDQIDPYIVVSGPYTIEVGAGCVVAEGVNFANETDPGPTAITLAGANSDSSNWAIIVVLFVGLALTGLTGLSLKRRHN